MITVISKVFFKIFGKNSFGYEIIWNNFGIIFHPHLQESMLNLMYNYNMSRERDNENNRGIFDQAVKDAFCPKLA